jgi:two-component sensor histidine kinase
MSSDSANKSKQIPESIEKKDGSDSPCLKELQDRLAFQDQFISMLIHEIRNPLHSIQAAVTLLENADNMNDVRKYMEHLSKGSQLMSEMINDLLEIRRLGQNEYKSNLDSIDLIELGDELIAAYKGVAVARNIEFCFEPVQEIFPVIVSDLKIIKRILINYITNALRFTERGGNVVLKCRAEPRGKDEYRISFEVTDTGVGIPEEDLPKIFDTFYKAKNRSPHNDARSGLGLSICRSLSEKIDARISCESKEGEGSSFRLDFVCKGSYPEVSLEESRQIRRMEMKRVLLLVSDAYEERLHSQFDHPQIKMDYGLEWGDFEEENYDYIFVDLRNKGLDAFFNQISQLSHSGIELVGFYAKAVPYSPAELLRLGMRCVYPEALSHGNICSVMELAQNPTYKGKYYWFNPHKTSELLSWDEMSSADHGQAIIDIFLKTVPSTIRCLQRACDLKEWTYQQKMIGSLINSFESMGASRLLQCLGQLQDAVWDKNQTQVRKFVNQLKLKHRKASKELQGYLYDYRKLNGS